jgi:predicted aldo/keto reductase-like oxidoreductase
MQTREYGKTGKLISVLSAGGMRYENPDDIDASAQVMVEAARLGVNYFDTAPHYSNDKSEDILGAAVGVMKRERLPYYVSTKTWAVEHDLVFEHLEKSLRRIGVERIDFMHAWGVNTWESFEERTRKGAFKALREAKEQGLIGHVVCSSHLDGPGIARLLDQGIFEGITLGFSAINFPFRTAGIEAAARNRVGVITMNPLGGGMIPDHEERFSFIRRRPDQPIVEAALHFNLAHPDVTSVLVGFRNVEDVRSAVRAVERFEPIGPDRMAEIQKGIETSFDSLCTTCDYCRDCPESIRVSSFMEAYNHHVLYGDFGKTKGRLKWHWGIDDLSALERCTSCRSCEDVCTQKLPILERFEDMKKLAETSR